MSLEKLQPNIEVDEATLATLTPQGIEMVQDYYAYDPNCPDDFEGDAENNPETRYQISCEE